MHDWTCTLPQGRGVDCRLDAVTAGPRWDLNDPAVQIWPRPGQWRFGWVDTVSAYHTVADSDEAAIVRRRSRHGERVPDQGNVRINEARPVDYWRRRPR